MKNQLLKKIFLNNQRQLISQKIVKWYLNHGRHDLPWRQKISPYRIWISEIMLQQTQVKTAIPYFKNFIKKYPTQKKLSEATEDQILALWSGLGFYRRARNIFKTKEIIKEEYNNRFPKKFHQLIELPGIGKSTAGAIMSLAYQNPYPILDGNVKRVITRLVNQNINLLKENQLWNLSSEFVNAENCFAYTQVIMDLGATVCTPANPTCKDCPVQNECRSAFNVAINKKRKVAQLKKVIPMNLSLIQTEDSLLLVKNEVSSIWKNLWIPFESRSLESYTNNFKLTSSQKIQHELTHRRLNIKLNTYISKNESKIKTNKKYKWIKKDRINEYGLPKPISKVINEL